MSSFASRAVRLARPRRLARALTGRGVASSTGPAAISGLLGSWDAASSVVTVARDGTGALAVDGDLVGRVTDLSGNVRHLEASADGTRPTFETNWLNSGLSCFRFASGKNLFNTAAAAVLAGVDQPYTVFYVALKDQDDAERYLGALTSSSQTNCDVNHRYVGSHTVADLPVVRMFHRSNAGGGTNTFNSPAGYGGMMVSVYCFIYTGTRHKVYQNGFLVIDEAATTGTFTFTHFSLGCSWDGTTQTGQGNLISAASLYAGALSDANRQAVEAYYANRIGLPYSAGATLARRFFWLGDSRFERFEGAPAQDGEVVSRRVARLCLPTETIHIVRALSGSTLAGADTSDLTEQWADTDDMVADGDCVLLNCGVNDIRLNATIQGDSTPFTTTDGIVDGTYWPQFVAIADDVLVENCDCIVDAMIPAWSGTWTGGEHHAVDRWNTLLKQWAGRYDRAVYNGEVLDAVTTNGFLNVADSSDSLHLNSSGHPKHAGTLLPHIAHLRVDPRDNANLVRWYSARMGVLFDDTDPIGDAGLELQDRSTIEDHAAQPTVGSRPTWQLGEAASNFQATVLFDGTNDFLSFGTVSLADEWTIILACDHDVSGNGTILAKSGATTCIRYLSGGSIAISNSIGDTVTFTPVSELEAFDVVVLRSDGRCWVNGVEATADSVLTGNLSLDTIGNLVANYFKGSVGDILIYDTALSDTVMREQATYIATKYGNGLLVNELAALGIDDTDLTTKTDVTDFIARFAEIVVNPSTVSASTRRYLTTGSFMPPELGSDGDVGARHLLYWLDRLLKRNKASNGGSFAYTGRLSEMDGWGEAAPDNLTDADPLGLVTTLEALGVRVVIIDHDAVDDLDASSRDGVVRCNRDGASDEPCTTLGLTPKSYSGLGGASDDLLYDVTNVYRYRFFKTLVDWNERNGSRLRYPDAAVESMTLIRATASTHVVNVENQLGCTVASQAQNTSITIRGYPGEWPQIWCGNSTDSDETPTTVAGGSSTPYTFNVGPAVDKYRDDIHWRNIWFHGKRLTAFDDYIFAERIIHDSGFGVRKSIRFCQFTDCQPIRHDEPSGPTEFIDFAFSARGGDSSYTAVQSNSTGFVFDSNYVEPAPDTFPLPLASESGLIGFTITLAGTDQRFTRNRIDGRNIRSPLRLSSATRPYVADNSIEAPYYKIIFCFECTDPIFERNYLYGNGGLAGATEAAGLDLAGSNGTIVRHNVIWVNETIIEGASCILIRPGETSSGNLDLLDDTHIYGNILFGAGVSIGYVSGWSDSDGARNDVQNMILEQNVIHGFPAANDAVVAAPVRIKLDGTLQASLGNAVRENNITRASGTAAIKMRTSHPTATDIAVTDTVDGITDNTADAVTFTNSANGDFRITNNGVWAGWLSSDMPFNAALSKAWTPD